MRGLVFAVVSGLAAAGWLYQYWTNPSAVRRQVLAKLGTHFVGAQVSLEGARLRLLGGISFSELRLTRRDDPAKTELAYIPSGVIYHDKEQLPGKLAIRKIELDRPRLHIVRGPDGCWSVSGILGIPDPSEPIPTIVIKRGTLVLEDRSGSTAENPSVRTMEIKDVNLTLINDPLRTLVFEAKGTADLTGEIRLTGTWQRDTRAMVISLDLAALNVGPPLAQWLACTCPELAEHARHLRGVAKLSGEIDHHPTGGNSANPSSPAVHYDLRCELTQGTLTHPKVPLPLDHLEASVRFVDGQVALKRLAARSGPTRVELKGTAGLSEAAPAKNAGRTCCFSTVDLEGDLTVERLQVDADFFQRLPDEWGTLREMGADYQPTGLVDLSMQFSRRAGQWRRQCRIQPLDVSASVVKKFNYLLEHVTGVIEDTYDQERNLHTGHLDLIGKADDRPVYIRGDVEAAEPAPAVHVDIWGNNIALDEKLLKALPPKQQALARSFHPNGVGDFVAQIRRKAGQAGYSNHYTIRIHDATACYDLFPYPLEEVSGLLDIQPDHWEFRDFRGRHKGGEFRTHGQSYPTPAGDRASITITGAGILLDEELEAALTPVGSTEPSSLQTAWKAFAPAGRMSFTATVDELPNRPQDIKVAVMARNCSIRPTFFPYALHDVSAKVSYGNGKVEVEKFSGQHGHTRLSVDKTTVLLKVGGGFYAELTRFQGAPIIPDNDFVTALPEGLRKVCTALELHDPVFLDTRLVIDTHPGGGKPDVYWDGGLEVRNATVRAGVLLEHVSGQAWCFGRHNGDRLVGVHGNVLLEQATVFNQPFRKIHTQIEVPLQEPEVLRLPSLKAQLFGGNIGGTARVELGPMLHYEVDLTALGVKLEEFGRHNRLGPNAQLSGQAAARLFLRGHGAELADLTGQGSIDVPKGKIKELLFLLDLLKVLNLRPPDRTLFEEVHATFGIRGSRVLVNRLDLYGNVVSLSGQGEMNLDGSDLQLDFYAVWARIVQVLPPILRDIPATIGQWVLKIKMRGSLANPRFTKEPVPVLVEPVERLVKRMTGQQKPEGMKPPASNPRRLADSPAGLGSTALTTDH